MSGGKTVAIIGAGPVGLAAAAHVLERGMSPIVLEAGPEAGHAVRQWQQVQLFSPWEYNVDKAAARLLAPTGWNSPDPQSYPTGGELLDRYLEPLATRTSLRDVIRTSSRVSAISRVGFDKAKTRGREQAPFEIRYQNGRGPEVSACRCRDRYLRHMVLAQSGRPQWLAGDRRARIRRPYRLWHAGCPGCRSFQICWQDRCCLGRGPLRGWYADRSRVSRRRSAGDAAVWLLRGADPAKAFGGGRNDKLAARGELGSAFAALVAPGRSRSKPNSASRTSRTPKVASRSRQGPVAAARSVVVDELIVSTGFRPDFAFCPNCVCGSIPPSRRRSRWRR